MREVVDAGRVRAFLREIGRRARGETRAYLTGGATAVLEGWRPSTVDIDLVFEPERDEIYRSLPELKEDLHVNVELAAPSHFIPELPGWRERSPFVVREGRLDVHHYDPYSQALAKIERGHAMDDVDVEAFIRRGLVDVARLAEFHAAIEPQLYRHPAIDPKSFGEAVRAVIERLR